MNVKVFFAGSFRVSLVIEREEPQHFGKGTIAGFISFL